MPDSKPQHFTVRPRLLRIPQAAQYIGGTNWFVEELCRNQKIAFLTVGKYRCIDVRELDRWIEAQHSAIPVRTIQHYLGHKSLETTMIYLGITDSAKLRKDIDQAFGD